MFRVLLSYQDREPTLFTIAQNMTFEQLREALLGPQPISLQATDGPRSVDTTGAISAIVQTLYGNRVTRSITIDIKEERIMADVQESAETTENSEVASGPTEGQKTVAEVPVDIVDPPESVSPEVISENVGQLTNILEKEERMDEETKVEQQFMSFREKFLDRKQSLESWESTIIGKMDKSIEKYQEIGGVYDRFIESLDTFKKEHLG